MAEGDKGSGNRKHLIPLEPFEEREIILQGEGPSLTFELPPVAGGEVVFEEIKAIPEDSPNERRVREFVTVEFAHLFEDPDESADRIIERLRPLLRLAETREFDLLSQEEVDREHVLEVIRRAFPHDTDIEGVEFVSFSNPFLPVWIGEKTGEKLFADRLRGLTLEDVLRDVIGVSTTAAEIRGRHYRLILVLGQHDSRIVHRLWEVSEACVGDGFDSPAGFIQLCWLLHAQLGLLMHGNANQHLQELSGLSEMFPKIPVFGHRFGTWIVGVK